jgi:hypothetical protein
MLTLLVVTKMVCEIALLSLLGRGLLALMAGANRSHNPFYGVLRMATQPFVRAVAFISPKVVLPSHHALVAFCVLAVLWLAVTLAKIQHCLRVGVSLCQ